MISTKENILITCLALTCASIFSGIETRYEGVTIKPFDVLLILVFIYYLSIHLLKDGKIQIRIAIKTASFIFLILFSFYVLINGILLSTTKSALKESLQLIEFSLLYVLIASSLHSQSNRRLFFKSFLSIIFFIASINAALHIMNGEISGYKRFVEPKHTYGIIATLSLFIYAKHRTKSHSLLLFFALILLILSGERKGWVAFTGCATYMALQQGLLTRKRILNAIAPIMLFLVLITAVFTLEITYIEKQKKSFYELYSLVVQRDIPTDEAEIVSISNIARLFIVYFGLMKLSEHPMFGIGTENFVSSISEFIDDDRLSHGAHNEYLRILVENGFVGFSIFSLFLFGNIFQLHRLKVTSSIDPQAKLIPIAFLYGIIGNFFIGDGAINTFLFILPLALYGSLIKQFKLEGITHSK